MSIDSSKHWLPPVPEPDDLNNMKRALFMETRSYLRRTVKKNAGKIVVKYLKPKHVNGLIDMFDEETCSLVPIVNVAIRLRNKTAWVLRSEKKQMSKNVYLPPEASAGIFNAIHEPLRIKLAHDMVHGFIREHIGVLRLQLDEHASRTTPAYDDLLKEIMTEFGEELQMIHGQICTGDLMK